MELSLGAGATRSMQSLKAIPSTSNAFVDIAV